MTAPDSTPTEREAGDVGEVVAVLAAHERGNDWCCTCGEDCFGGSAAYSDALFRAHRAAKVECIIAEREAQAWDEGRSAALAPVAGAPDGTFAKSRYRMRTEDAILALPNPYRAALAPEPEEQP